MVIFKIRGWRGRDGVFHRRRAGNLSDRLLQHNAAAPPGECNVCEARCQMVSSGDLRECALISHEGSMEQERQMTTFDDARNGFEKKFAHDEELRFKATARRNKLFGLWAPNSSARRG